MISMVRARQCPGRPVMQNGEIVGVVMEAGVKYVWVREFGEDTPRAFLPEDLDWAVNLPSPLREALINSEELHGTQVSLTRGRDEFHVFSEAVGNDDGVDHLLYVILPRIQRAYPARPTAIPWVAFEIEEALGWAQP